MLYYHFSPGGTSPFVLLGLDECGFSRSVTSALGVGRQIFTLVPSVWSWCLVLMSGLFCRWRSTDWGCSCCPVFVLLPPFGEQNGVENIMNNSKVNEQTTKASSTPNKPQRRNLPTYPLTPKPPTPPIPRIPPYTPYGPNTPRTLRIPYNQIPSIAPYTPYIRHMVGQEEEDTSNNCSMKRSSHGCLSLVGIPTTFWAGNGFESRPFCSLILHEFFPSPSFLPVASAHSARVFTASSGERGAWSSSLTFKNY